VRTSSFSHINSASIYHTCPHNYLKRITYRPINAKHPTTWKF